MPASSHSLKRYLFALVVFSGVVSAIIFLWQQNVPARFQTGAGWFLLIFFTVTTFAIHFFLTLSKDPKKFVTRFMLISGFRLFGYLSFLTVYAILKREAALGFTLLFLTMYLLYSAFEVAALLKFFKK